jgi:hypothetical protein
MTMRPIFLSRPDWVSGMPIIREILPLNALTPVARRQEKLKPGQVSFSESFYCEKNEGN